jgi:hypothetical protein
MKSKKPPVGSDVPLAVESLHRRIEQWRQVCRHRQPMPEPLWRQAARLARQSGVARISRLLRLNYNALKQRLDSFDTADVEDPGNTPAFVELTLPSAAPATEYIVELEHPGGGRMRMHVKGAVVPDLAALSRSFWGMGS